MEGAPIVKRPRGDKTTTSSLKIEKALIEAALGAVLAAPRALSRTSLRIANGLWPAIKAAGCPGDRTVWRLMPAVLPGFGHQPGRPGWGRAASCPRPGPPWI